MSDSNALSSTEQAAGNAFISPAVKTFISLAAVHFMVDCLILAFPMFKTLAGLDLKTAGAMSAVAVIFGAALQPFFGALADHGWRRRLLFIGAGLVCINALLGPLGRFPALLHSWHGYAVLFLMLVSVNVGSSMFHPAALSLAGGTSQANRSTVLALFIACGQAGMMSSHLLFSRVYLYFDQRTEILLVPAVAFILWAWVWSPSSRDADPPRRPTGFNVRGLRELPYGLIPLWFIQVLMTAVGASFIFLMPEFAMQHGFDEKGAWVNGGAMAVWTAGAVSTIVFAGQIADRFGKRRTLLAALVLATPCFLYMAVGEMPQSTRLVLMFITGGLVGSIGPIGIGLGQQMAPGRESLATGLLMGFAWAAASPAQWISSTLAVTLEQKAAGAVACLTVCLALASVLVFFIPRIAPARSD
jgi:MFS family permease